MAGLDEDEVDAKSIGKWGVCWGVEAERVGEDSRVGDV
jgi:hypothetical protein